MPDPPQTTGSPLSIGEVASLAGVTVRTLHHYDAIGLLSPAGRASGGYRTYAPADVARLQRILFYRELEIPLERIAQLIDDPESHELDHLRHQLAQLTERIERLGRIRDAVLTTMEAHEMSIELTPAERLEVFGDHDPAQFTAEAERRWGSTDEYRESKARVRRYAKADWERITTEAAAIEHSYAAAMHAGAPATSAAAMDAAERARLHIDEWYYPLGHEQHRGLGDLYVAGARFTAHYEEQAPGLAHYVRDAIHANADRASRTSG